MKQKSRSRRENTYPHSILNEQGRFREREPFTSIQDASLLLRTHENDRIISLEKRQLP
jgi:hypothetical protein